MKLKLIPLMLLNPSISNAEISNQNKFAALAVDRNNGFAYGFAYDNPKSTIAEKRALEECNLRSKNSNCSIVLSWSGEGCGVYRSIDENVGSAYGWGIAKSRGEADIIATREAQKRSGGQNVSNFVWACNSNVKNKLNVIKNLSPTEKKTDQKTANVKTITIGNQTWMAENLSTSKFANTEKIPVLNSIDEYKKKGDQKTTLSVVLQKEHFYNWFAATDSRNICPIGFRVPTTNDWNTLINTLGSDPVVVAKQLKSKNLWSQTGSDDYNFTAKPVGILTTDDKYLVDVHTAFWSQTPSTVSQLNGEYFLFDASNKAKMSGNRKTALASVRCIKN